MVYSPTKQHYNNYDALFPELCFPLWRSCAYNLASACCDTTRSGWSSANTPLSMGMTCSRNPTVLFTMPAWSVVLPWLPCPARFFLDRECPQEGLCFLTKSYDGGLPSASTRGICLLHYRHCDPMWLVLTTTSSAQSPLACVSLIWRILVPSSLDSNPFHSPCGILLIVIIKCVTSLLAEHGLLA